MLLFLSPACGILDVQGIRNCSLSNGTWLNHTCLYDNTTEALNRTTINVDQLIDDLLSTRQNPSDEYFQ